MHLDSMESRCRGWFRGDEKERERSGEEKTINSSLVHINLAALGSYDYRQPNRLGLVPEAVNPDCLNHLNKLIWSFLLFHQ